jgi:hypothetical protein
METPLFLGLLRSVIHGTREVPDREILDAYNRALLDYRNANERTSTASRVDRMHYRDNTVSAERVADLIEERAGLIRRGAGVTVEDIMAASPVMVSTEPMAQFRQILKLFPPEEYVYAGDAFGGNVVPVTRLKNISRIATKVPSAHIIPNTFTGVPAPKKGGEGMSYRCDNAVAAFQFAMAEFDDLPMTSQLAFWSQVELPISALVFSGGKSVHAWIRLSGVSSMADWKVAVEKELYGDYLVPMGVDRACKNPSRLSRTPGYFREEKGQVQQLLYLCPEGKALAL